MKKQLTQLTILACILFIPIFCYAEWSAMISAQGQPIDGLYKSSIVIGEADVESSNPAPPQAPVFSCAIVILSDDWRSRISQSMKGPDEIKEWVLEINPCGNACGFGEATTTVRWQPDQLGPGVFEIREGYDGTGPIVVTDMKSTDHFTLTGANEPYYYTIIKR
ncbi:MAG: hypothetical protein OMM_09996 [Candidatus Magnetoglobus multicellularis str. Araruama]|uniref:Uncharacterized protein n=1 Tax=Candidatus Magnetoglobus multicellularis str. Araruama TaxID=890399 RepID=A0A1V1P283_9BACT|nr:MAG: hypothetical protein OMM_09996 [Candidatus Magnetoglobus multicellularis str. Araruama]